MDKTSKQPGCFNVWSPHRDSRLVQVFKAALSARPESWTWCDDPHHASWWVVDGTLLDRLEMVKLEHITAYKVMLAPSITRHHNPSWTFFKVPLNTALLFRWIESCLLRMEKPDQPLDLMIKLTRWPNISSYSEGLSPTACMQLTMACSRLLENWIELDSAHQLVGHPDRLERLLKDAESAGILESREIPKEAIKSLPPTNMPPDTYQEKKEFNNPIYLLKRMMRKFT